MCWSDKYRDALLDKTENPSDIRGIIKPHIPRYLYKYGRFDSSYWKDTIFKGKIHLSRAIVFNDPFDCKANFDYKKAVNEGRFREKLLEKYTQHDIELLSQNDIYQNVIQGMREDVFVFCFSEVWDSILMWAHYANNYTGYCIEYDISKVKEYMKYNLYPVLYEKEYINITENLINCNKNTGLICNLSKSVDWAYEKEWRIVEYRENPFYYRKAIKSIYLGCNCSNVHKNEITKWAKDNDKEIYLVEPAKTQYKLEAYKISK